MGGRLDFLKIRNHQLQGLMAHLEGKDGQLAALMSISNKDGHFHDVISLSIGQFEYSDIEGNIAMIRYEDECVTLITADEKNFYLGDTLAGVLRQLLADRSYRSIPIA